MLLLPRYIDDPSKQDANVRVQCMLLPALASDREPKAPARAVIQADGERTKAFSSQPSSGVHCKHRSLLVVRGLHFVF